MTGIEVIEDIQSVKHRVFLELLLCIIAVKFLDWVISNCSALVSW